MIKYFLIVFAAFMIFSTTTMAGKDEKISFDSLPNAIKENFKKIKYDKITEVEKEKKKGKIVFEVEFSHEGKLFEEVLVLHQDPGPAYFHLDCGPFKIDVLKVDRVKVVRLICVLQIRVSFKGDNIPPRGGFASPEASRRGCDGG